MNDSQSSLHRGRAFLASFTAAAFAFSLAVAASPELHARLHPDASKTEHTCAATLIASGGFNHSSPPVLVESPAQTESPFPVSLAPRWVRSTFLTACVFEHAPPVIG